MLESVFAWEDLIFLNLFFFKNYILTLHSSKKADHVPSSPDDNIIADLKKFFIQSREQNKSISDEIKEITLIETRKDLSKFQLFNILLPSMYDDMSLEIVNKDLVQKEKLFKMVSC